MSHKIRHLLQGSALLLAAALSGWSNAQVQTQRDIHLEAATRNTGGDKFLKDWTRDRYCMYVDNPALLAAIRTQKAPLPMTRIFDDVWFLGFENVGQFLLKNSNGSFAMVDTLNSTSDADTYTIPALQMLGVGPQAPLSAIYLTHGHFDHDGGASRLRQVYGPNFPIYMGSGDVAGKAYAPTAMDSANFGYQHVNLGNRPLTVIASPGHTPGTMSAVIPVQDNGVERKLLIVGGTAIPTTISASRSYLQSVERMYAAVKDLGVEGTLHPHGIIDGGNQHMADIIASGSRTPNPYILGNEKMLRTVAIMRECGAAQVAQVDATSHDPVWRVTSVDFVDGPTPDNVAVRVSSGWGPVAYQNVTFTNPQTGAVCVAATNQDGVARCGSQISPLRPFQDQVTVTFGGAQSADFVDLPSTRSAAVGAGKASPRGR